ANSKATATGMARTAPTVRSRMVPRQFQRSSRCARNAYHRIPRVAIATTNDGATMRLSSAVVPRSLVRAISVPATMPTASASPPARSTPALSHGARQGMFVNLLNIGDLAFGSQPVANAPDRLDGVADLAKLLAQAQDHVVDGPVAADVVLLPDCIQQVGA